MIAPKNLSTIALIVYWLALFAGTHYPRHLHFLEPLQHSDKLLHFVGYAGLAFLFAYALRRPWTWLAGLGIAGLLSVYGAVDELTQPWVGRDCELFDWYADVLGTVAGLALFQIAGILLRRRSRHAPTLPDRDV